METRELRSCSCLGFCKGRDGLSDRYLCVIESKPGKVRSRPTPARAEASEGGVRTYVGELSHDYQDEHSPRADTFVPLAQHRAEIEKLTQERDKYRNGFTSSQEQIGSLLAERDALAAHALMGLLASGTSFPTKAACAEYAYQMADAMLAARTPANEAQHRQEIERLRAEVTRLESLCDGQRESVRENMLALKAAQQEIQRLTQERDEAIALLHGDPPIPNELTLPEKVRDLLRLQDTETQRANRAEAERDALSAHVATAEGDAVSSREASMRWQARAEKAEAEIATLREQATRYENAQCITCGRHFVDDAATEGGTK